MVVCPQRLRRDPGKEENLVIHPHRRTLMSRHVKLKLESIASTTLLDLPCLFLWWPPTGNMQAVQTAKWLKRGRKDRAREAKADTCASGQTNCFTPCSNSAPRHMPSAQHRSRSPI